MLDTHIASFAIRGANVALQAKLGAHAMSALCMSAITEAEVLVGLAKRPEAANLKQGLATRAATGYTPRMTIASMGGRTLHRLNKRTPQFSKQLTFCVANVAPA